MANICMYKIMVKGRKQACYALVNMMPLYSWEKECVSEEGTDDDFTLVFSGACKWSVDCYTSKMKNPAPFTDEELNAVQDGDHWDKTLKDKSILLDCEIFCNSKDIDDGGWAIYDHYNRGKVVHDECPKELHIKRGRDYDNGMDVSFTLNLNNHPVGRACKVKFESGAYTYAGKYEVGDIVKVEGAKSGCIGRVVDTNDSVILAGLHNIIERIGHSEPFITADIEAIWSSYSPKERKEYLAKIGMDEKTTKKKFVSVMDWRWTEFALSNNNWEEFLRSIR